MKRFFGVLFVVMLCFIYLLKIQDIDAANKDYLYYIMNDDNDFTYYKVQHTKDKVWELEEMNTILISRGKIINIDDDYITIETSEDIISFVYEEFDFSIGDELFVFYTSIAEGAPTRIYGITRIIII